MKKILTYINRIFLIFILTIFSTYKIYAEELDLILEQIETLQQDIKTLEKAVYNQTGNIDSSSGFTNNDSDVLTKHLLKLSDLEEQFTALTNNFEEINFKLDKLSNRITKIQKDNQMRFQDIESSGTDSQNANKSKKKKKKLPGSDEPQDLGTTSYSDTATSKTIQETQSIESAGTVITEQAERTEKLLPDGTPEEKYKFAISFLQVGDYETAEYALREFIDNHSKHKLAGNAQYWYGETFRVRQLYQDAATAYLDGYQKYPDSVKAPINLLKLGVMLVQIGEKEQGCSMILGIKKQYPKANQSVTQKAEYEKKKFNCDKKN
jgi:tol-pal system protein YbgF